MTATIKPIRPVWLRPGALVAVLGLHLAAAMVVTIEHPPMPAADESIEITIAEGTPVAEEPPAPAPEPPPPPEPEPPKPEPPPPVPPPPPELPPPPEPPPPEIPDPPKRVAPDAPAYAKPKPPPKPRPKPPEPPPQDAPPPPATRAGEQDAVAKLTQLKATYAGKVLQEIRAHRIAASGVGSVVVSFTVDADGGMNSVKIVRGSGISELDITALRMVRAARPGPPPDGRFSGSTTINFVDR